MLLNKLGLEQWPDVSDQYLLATIETWLAPFLDSISKLSDFQRLDLQSILSGLLPWPLPRQLEELAPKTMTVPSGSSIKIDYTQSPPVLSVKLQEMFGCLDTPTIANGKVKLMLHLLSPAQRPLQVTQDLAGFWQGSYSEVKKEMKGRYPRHPWPDRPEQALPTKYTKRRS
jgi:ATP-dependent helicase HrpB